MQYSGNIKVPEKIRTFLSQLEQNGHAAYIVGGAVRDMLIGIEPEDWDIATSAVPGQIKATFMYLIKSVKQIDAAFPVVLVDGIEIATFRVDAYENGEQVTVETVKTIEKDLARRDLTVNAMAMDKNGNIFDPYGGHRDLVNGIIRFVGDPVKRIYEDPCRIIRACRFLASIDGHFSEGTHVALYNSVHYGHHVKIPSERIRLEILKAMKCKKASKFFIALHGIGLLAEILPSLAATFGADHGQYHSENIFDHMMIAGDFAGKHFPAHCLRKPMFRLVNYLHDIGKSTPNYKDGDVHFYDHEVKGAAMIETELKSLKFTTAEIKYAKNLVLVHMRGHVKMSPKSTRKCIKTFRKLDVNWKEWLALKCADRAANVSRSSQPLKVQKIAKKFLHELEDKPHKKGPGDQHFYDSAKQHPKPCFEIKQLAISGTRIQKLLGIGPSMVIGVILEFLLTQVINNPDLNTREQLDDLIIGKQKARTI
jgi:tRNA nucleotidyltransferase/poly(A) polymerase